MSSRLSPALAELARAAAVAAVAIIAGYIVGVGFAKARGLSQSTPRVIVPKAVKDSTPTTSTPTRAAAPAQPSTKSSAESGTRPISAENTISLPGARLALASGELRFATRPAGRARQRARVTLSLRFANSSDRDLTVPKLVLFVNGHSIDPTSTAPSLQNAVSAGGSAAGDIRYEIAGDDTKALSDRGAAKLVVKDQVMQLSVGR